METALWIWVGIAVVSWATTVTLIDRIVRMSKQYEEEKAETADAYRRTLQEIREDKA